jgi:hypothetical protein
VPGQTLTAEAFVIEKRPPADRFQTFVLFSAEHGNLLALQRISKKAAAQNPVPDLFDEVSASLETSNQGRTWFVREARITRRRPGIGRGYETLRFASLLAAVVGRNPVHEDSREAVSKLLSTALDSFSETTRPDIVYLKSLYLLARNEGYPVKQEWIPSLRAADRAVAAALLNSPVGQHASAEAEVARILSSLEGYLGSSTEIILP